MKRKSAGFLAGVLVASMVATPLSYANVYAEDQDATGIVQQETEEVSSDTGHAQEESTDVKEESKEELKTEENITSEQPEDNAGVLETEAGNPETEISQGSQMTEAETKVTETPVQPTVDIDGVKVLKNDGSEYGMFPVVVDKMEVKDDQVKVSFHTGTKKVFDWLYLGPVTDTEKNNYIVGNNTGSTCEFSISVPLSKANNWIPIAVGRSDKGTWSDNYLWMSIPNPKEPVINSQPPSPEQKTDEDGNGDGENSDNNSTEDNAYITKNDIQAIYASDDIKKPGQAYSMIKIAESEAKIIGDKIQVSIWVKPASSGNFTYDAIYIGRKDDAEKTPLVMGEVDSVKNLEKFTFEVPNSMAGGEVHFVPRKKKDGTFSINNSLALKIPALDVFKKQTEVVIQSQPKGVIAKNNTQVSLNVVVNGDESVKLNYQWQYSADGTSWTDCDGISAKTNIYTFQMAIDKIGQYRCIISDSNGTTVTSDVAKVENPSVPTVTGSKVQVVKADGSAFKMFVVNKSKVQKDGDNLEITISTKNVSFDKLYLGEKEDIIKNSVVKGTELADGGYTFTFQVPVSYSGKVLPVTLGKVDGTWYSKQDLWIYIPYEGIESFPTATDEVKVIAGGTGSTFNDFVIVSSKAVLRGENIRMTLDVKGNKWTKIYLGVQADTDKTPVYKGTYDLEKNVTTFTFDIQDEKQGMNIAITPGNENWFTWARDLFINIPNLENRVNTTAEGVYNLYGSAYPTTNSYSLNFERESSVSISGDQATVTWVTQAGLYDRLYIGNTVDSDEVKEANAIVPQDRSDIASGYKSFTFTMPVSELGKEFSYSVRTVKTGEWSTKDARAFINGILEKTGELPDPDPTPDPNPGVVVPADGIYKVNNVVSSSGMFRVVGCTLTVKNGKMSAVLTLSGTGYDYLYLGTKEEAAKADKSLWVPFKEDNNGKYTYTVLLESLDKEIAVAAFSHNKQSWYDRTLVFHSDSLEKIGDISNGGNGGTNGGSTTPSGSNNGSILKPNDGKVENESKYEADTSGATSKVNSSTVLADGVYTPDRFTWSGGTGKVKIYCNKITIQNGQAYATLVFDSDHYQYVKANGNTYYTSKGGGTATVTIPIALNQNNKILGMTDKMSVAHEIEYTIFVYLAAAGNGTTLGGASANKQLDEKAPEIMGLEYQSETQLDYAEYFKIYHYDQGITLVEIDMTKGTANDPEKLAAEAINSDPVASEKKDAAKDTKADKNTAKEDTFAVETAEDGEENLNGISKEELATELYKGNVVKYLLVPEGVEVPVGLDQDMIVVQRPVDKIYTSTEEILEKMDELGLTDNVVAIGDKKKDCKVDSIVKKMDKKDGEDKAQVVYGGKEEKPDFKTLVKQETNLAILSSDILPKEEDITDLEKKQKKDDKLTVEEQTERFRQMTEKFALLGIPVIVDRSEDEQTELAKREWIKIYGVLFGCEDEMNELFDQAVKDAGDDALAQVRTQAEE